MSEYNTSRRKVPPKEEEQEKVEEKPETPKDETYFIRVSVFHYFCVISGFLMFWFVCFMEDVSLFKKLGGPGHRILYLRDNYLIQMRISFYVAILLHVFEAFYAHQLCKGMQLLNDVTMKWVIQTFIVGYSSLRHLINYQAPKEEETETKKTD